MQIFFLRILWHWIFNENIRDSGNYQQNWCKYFLKKSQTQRKQRFQNSNTQQMKVIHYTKIEKMFLIHFEITRKLQSHIIDSKWQKENDEMWFLFGDYFLIYRVDVNGCCVEQWCRNERFCSAFFFLSLLSIHLFLVVVVALLLSFISLLLFTGNEIEKEMCALRIESSEHWNRQRIEWIHLFLILVKSM